jgi:serralysin
MTQIDASGLGFAFNAFAATSVQHAAPDGVTADHYTWVTAGSAPYFRITAFSFDEDIATGPLSGSIDTVNITNDSYAPGLSITGLDAQLSGLIDVMNPATNQEKFWETVLAGATSVVMPTQPITLNLMGDYVTVNAGQTRVGSADVFGGTATLQSSSNLVGDALSVDAGATLSGGNDQFNNVAAAVLIGDVGNPASGSPSNLGTVNGGNDTFTLIDTNYSPAVGVGNVVGDVLTNGAGGTSHGGDDTITLRNGFGTTLVAGDNTTNNGLSTGGDDTVLLETTIAGRTFANAGTVAGDDNMVSNSVGDNGGNDTITLNNVNATTLVGDFYQVDSSVAVGGDDTIAVKGTFALSTPAPPYQINPGVTSVQGDAYTANGTTALQGGADTITLVNAIVTSIQGDVYGANATGAFTGGNDTISQTFNRGNTSASGSIAGDAYFGAALLFTCGDDKITLDLRGSQSSSSNTLVGDVAQYSATGNGSMTGGNDVLTFNSEANQTSTLFGDAQSASASGNLTVDDGNDTLTGGAGNDLLYGDTVSVTAGGTATRSVGNDLLDGRGGNDMLDGGLGSDTAAFSLSQAVHVDLTGVAGSASSDLFEAVGQGNDQLINIENVRGSALADIIAGDGQSNVIRGGGGKDLLDGRGGTQDYIDFSDKTTKVEITLLAPGSTGTAKVNGVVEDTFKNFEAVIGGSAGDALTGNAGSNNIAGGKGNDTVVGASGNDTVFGGEGDDLVAGSLGNDQLTGNAGADLFRFNSTLSTSANLDTITDFVHASDEIQLDDAIFTALTSPWSSAQFKTAASGHVANTVNQHILYDRSTGVLWYDPDGSGAGGQTAFAKLGTSTHPTIDWTDFQIV